MIALVTGATNPALCDDDQPLVRALAKAGVDAEILLWDDESVDWSRFADVVLRSPWDYPSRPAQFLAWLDRVAEHSHVHNSPAVVRRNLHKRYLAELTSAVPTVIVATQEQAQQVAQERGWETAVIKPAIGLGGRSVAMFASSARPDEMPLQGDSTEWCVQPYLPSIRTEGEYSVVLVDGVPQHALLKRPGPADFRVHDGRGGTHAAHPLTAELVTAARTAMDEFGAPGLLFARVDLIRLDAGRLAVMEIDAVSPCLYTEHNSGLAAVFAAAVARRGVRTRV